MSVQYFCHFNSISGMFVGTFVRDVFPRNTFFSSCACKMQEFKFLEESHIIKYVESNLCQIHISQANRNIY